MRASIRTLLVAATLFVSFASCKGKSGEGARPLSIPDASTTTARTSGDGGTAGTATSAV
ncbi:MAG: hypothetical protein JWM74_3102, partial [Myxococcaceae bacterium]|nr:hypothetical protein [Myxococcaceae bacterium]